MLFKPVPVSVAFLRGTTADEDGNITMEEEAVLGEMLAMAQATRRAGGIVIVQVKRMAQRGTLPGKQVKIPGILVDFVVVRQSSNNERFFPPSLYDYGTLSRLVNYLARLQGQLLHGYRF